MRCTTIEHIIQGHTVVNHSTTETYLPKVSLALSKAYITHISIYITRVYNHTRLLHGRMNVVKDVLMGKGDLKASTTYALKHEVA